MDSPNIGNAELIAQINRCLVLQAVRALQPTFRAEVSRWTNLNPATVTAITAELIQSKLLTEIAGQTRSAGPSGGRPPMMLELNNDSQRILAIDLEPDVLRVALLGLGLDIVSYREEPLDRQSRPEAVIKQLASLAKEVLRASKPQRLDGIGLSLPGLLDRERGLLIGSTNMPKWKNVPIRELVAHELGMEPKIERACHLAAMHEDWVDSSRSNNTKLVISLRTGIGMSLVRKGELYLGAGGFDGEVGHTVIDLKGQMCECGNRGCLETFVRPDAIRARAKKLIAAGRGKAIAATAARGKQLRPEDIYLLAKGGDIDAASIVADVGRYLGLAAANLVNLLAPDVFILCGSIDAADELILAAICKEIDKRVLPQLRRNLEVRLSVGQEKSSLLGAGVLVARDFFDLPKLISPRYAGDAASAVEPVTPGLGRAEASRSHQ